MNKRRPLIAGNWKMYKTATQAVAAVNRLVELVADVRDVDILIAPPYTALADVSPIAKKGGVALAAQNLFWENEGAFTGEVAGPMLTDAGCTHVIIGHSERRQFFNESDENVNKKIGAAIRNGLIPILCVGETEQQRDARETFSVLDKQVKKGLENAVSTQLHELIVAYEPVWAIGTGKTATKEQAQEAHAYIRSLLGDIGGDELSKTSRILYGGSVKPGNISGLMAMDDIDGALVGGASLDPDTFGQIVKFQ